MYFKNRNAMKRFLIAACMACMALAADAQKISVGDRAPEVKAAAWPDKAPRGGERVRMIEFFYSRSAPSMARVAPLDAMAEKYGGRLDVIVVCREDAVTVAKAIGGSHTFYTAIDDENRTFAAYGVQYIPYGVVVDAKGRVVWAGNPEKLSDEELGKYLK